VNDWRSSGPGIPCGCLLRDLKLSARRFPIAATVLAKRDLVSRRLHDVSVHVTWNALAVVETASEVDAPAKTRFNTRLLRVQTVPGRSCSGGDSCFP